MFVASLPVVRSASGFGLYPDSYGSADPSSQKLEGFKKTYSMTVFDQKIFSLSQKILALDPDPDQQNVRIRIH